MAVVKVANSRNVVGAIRYLLESDSHDGEHERVGAVSTQHMTVSRAKYEALETLKRFNKTEHVHAQLMIQSFSVDELDPDSQEDLDKANSIGHETAKQLFGENRQFIVVTQADNGKVHNHVVCVSPDLETGRSLRGAQTGFKKTKEISDAVIEEHGVRNINKERDHTYRDRQSIGEVKRREEGRYVWKDDLKSRIAEALEDPQVVDEATFIDKMHTVYGVKVRFRGKGVSYSFTDQENKKRTSRAKALGTMYGVEGIKYAFAEAERVQRERAEQDRRESELRQLEQLSEIDIRELNRVERSDDREVERDDTSDQRDAEESAYVERSSRESRERTARTERLTDEIRNRTKKQQRERDRQREERAKRDRIARERAFERFGGIENSPGRSREQGLEY